MKFVLDNRFVSIDLNPFSSLIYLFARDVMNDIFGSAYLYKSDIESTSFEGLSFVVSEYISPRVSFTVIFLCMSSLIRG